MRVPPFEALADVGEACLDEAVEVARREHEELVVEHRLVHDVGNLRGWRAAGDHLAVPLRGRVVVRRIVHTRGSVAFALEDAGVDQAWTQHRDADAGSRELASHRGSEADDRVLRHAVGRERRRVGHARDAGGAHHVAGSLLHEDRTEHQRAVDHAAHVDVEHPLPDLRWGVEHRADRRDTGVEAHDVHRTESFEGLVTEAPGVVDRTHVVGHAHHALATTERVERGGDRVLLDVGDDDVHARPQEPCGHRLPDAAGTAGDHADLARRIVQPGARHGHLTITTITRPSSAA